MWSDERETKSECYLGPTYYSDSDLSIIKHLVSRISLSLSIEMNAWF